VGEGKKKKNNNESIITLKTTLMKPIRARGRPGKPHLKRASASENPPFNQRKRKLIFEESSNKTLSRNRYFKAGHLRKKYYRGKTGPLIWTKKEKLVGKDPKFKTGGGANGGREIGGKER